MNSKIHLTKQRHSVYEVVREATDHPTAADVMDRLREKGLQFAYGTVYNSLRYLTNAGLIRELQLGETASRYDGNVIDHQHIVCRVCTRVDEVYAPIPIEWQDAVTTETQYIVDSHKVLLWGTCPSCQKKRLTSEQSPGEG